MKRLAVGILAQVDAGKTTLTEGLLFTAGAIQKLGRVDHGNAFLDTFSLERARGITIFSKQAVLEGKTLSLTLLDTPGHIDFSAEMERVLQVLDLAILVVSGSDGVQPHTETLWRLLARHRIPTFLWVNKMDLAGWEKKPLLLAELQQKLSGGCVDGSVEDAGWYEALAACDEELLDAYLAAGRLTAEEISTAIARRTVFPCYFGAALGLKGVKALWQGLEKFSPLPHRLPAFSARVYKISRDAAGNRLTHLKIMGGTLRVRSLLTGTDRTGKPWSEKVTQLRLYSGSKFTPIEEAEPGMVVAVTGLTATYPGEGLGDLAAGEAPLLEPVLHYRVDFPGDVDPHTVLEKLRILEEEDPSLRVVWNEAVGELHLRLMGEMQLEILREVLRERFSLPVRFDAGSIVYEETIAAPVEGVGHYEPLRHYAEVHLLLEPAPRGSGVQLATACSEDFLEGHYQRQILSILAETPLKGVLVGGRVTDLVITLLVGKAHPKHTEGGDFREATLRALRQGLQQAESVLLEPWYAVTLSLPANAVGRAMNDLQRMGGEISPPTLEGDTAILTGAAPVAGMQGYLTTLLQYTAGRGGLSCLPAGYRPCPHPDPIVEKIGYDSEADLAHPADSVFCAKGAGYTVGWREVFREMHLESGWHAGTTPHLIDRSTPYADRPMRQNAALDAEILKIFERTYGAIPRDPRADFRVICKEISEKIPALPQATSPDAEYLLVDGYNIIFAWEELSALARDNLDAARQRLLQQLCNYQGFRQCELIVVFDAYKIKGNPGSVEQFHNLKVVYTKEAETADMYIEKATHALARERRVRVATSDGVEQLIILGQGAQRISAPLFHTEVLEVESLIRSYLHR